MKINSIQGKIIVYSGLAALLTTILLIVIFKIAADNRLKDDIENRLRKKAELAAYSFDKLNKKISAVSEITGLIQKSGLYKDQFERNRFLNQILSNNIELYSAYLITDDNIKYNEAEKITLIEPVKFYFRSEKGIYDIYNVEKKVINCKYYSNLKENNFAGCYISEPIVQNGISVIQYITPVIVNNKWEGVIILELKESFLEDILSRFNRDNISCFLLSRDNKLIVGNKNADRIKLYEVITGNVAVESENYLFQKEIIKTGSWMIYLAVNSSIVYSETNYIFYSLLMLGIFAFIMGIVGLFFVSKQILNPINRGLKLCGEIIDNNSVTEQLYKGKDEAAVMLNSLQAMGKRTTTVFSKIKHLALEVKMNSDDLHISYKMQEKSVEGFRKQVDNISISITEINSKADELLNVINMITEKSKSTFKSVSDGSTVLIPLAQKVKELAISSEQNTINLEKLYKDSIKISTVITTINKIAEKTNMLALNATIEAEKAGDYGDGFALVASEIRKLSTQINNSIYEIELIIDEIKTAVFQALNETKLFLSKTENNSNKIDNVVGEVDELVVEIESLIKQFSSIKEIIEEQNSTNQELKSITHQLNEDVVTSVNNLSSFNKSNNMLDNAVNSLREI